MAKIPGARPPELYELTRAQDRMTFVYLERCVVDRESNALTAVDEKGTVHIPVASLGALLLGPGTRISHQAMVLIAESGSTVVWTGERGVRCYAHGRSLARTSRLLEAQANLVTNRSSRLRVAREMYAMRFPGEDVSGLTMQQLRGREGARVRRAYREAAKASGVEWKRRDYDPKDFAAGDPVNQALSAAATALYGVAHAVIVTLGCSPGLGFVHTGHAKSFVYDIADLYKAEYAIPTAFQIAAGQFMDVGAETRRAMRDVFADGRILDRCAADIRRLLSDGDESVGEEADDGFDGGSGGDDDVVYLWDGGERRVSGGTSYGVDW